MRIRDLPLNIHIRLWGGVINSFTSSALFPFMALLLAESVGKEFTGTYLISLVIITFIANIVAGYYIDILPRKQMLIISANIEMLCMFFMTFLIWKEEMVLFIIIFTISNIVSSFRRPALQAIVQDAVTEKSRDLVYRLDYWLINIAIAFGTLLGGALFTNYKILLFLMVSFSTLTITLLYAIFIEDDSVIKKKTVSGVSFFKEFLNSYAKVFEDKRYLLLIVSMILIFSAEASTNGYVSIRLFENFQTISILGINIDGVKMFTLMNFTNTLIVAVFTLIIGSISEKIKQKNLLILGMSLYIVGYSVNMSANIWWVLIIMMTIASFGELIYAPIVNSQMVSLIPADKRGVYNAISSIQINGAEIISRVFILIGISISPIYMSLILLLLLLIGATILIYSLYFKKRTEGLE